MATGFVILKLGHGDWQQGFPQVVAQLWVEQSPPTQVIGSLPPAPDCVAVYDQWRFLYQAVTQTWVRRGHPAIDIEETGVTHVSRVAFDRLSHTLTQQFNTWLDSPGFSRIERQIRTLLHPSQTIQVMIETADLRLRQFPWHLWQFFADYPGAEAALSTPEYGYAHSPRSPAASIRILAVLGNRDGIDLQPDQQILTRLPQVQVTVLNAPDRPALDQALWDKAGWDLLFFAGHTTSQPDRFTGEIAINASEHLTIDQLKHALKAAISRGLRLVLFNSCDGLGLAWAMADLQIPQLIVMREAVPDRVAQDFLVHLLSALSQGQSLYPAVREAREKLQGLETEFPCASWLPVICQNPAAISIDRPWISSPPARPHPAPPSPPLLLPLLITTILMGLRWLGLLQSWELAAFDHLMRLRPAEGTDPRILVVEVTQTDTDQWSYPLSDQTLATAITALNAHQPAIIGVDMHRSQARREGRSAFLQAFEQPNLFLACSFGVADPNPPPPEFSPEQQIQQLGFSDLIVESAPFGQSLHQEWVSQGASQDTNTVRRQLLSYDPRLATSTSACRTPYSLSLQLAFRFLLQAEVQPLAVNPQQDWQFGNTTFPKLPTRFGGYQPLEGQGQISQVMLNYRAGLPGARVTLTDLLRQQVNPDLIRNRIVLIGTTDLSAKDRFDTPYGEMPGVWIHAHMVSQLLSAVLDDRPLIWSLPSAGVQLGDWLWVGVWALLGGGLGWRWRSWVWFEVANTTLALVLHQLCLLVLVQGGWMPLVPSMLALLLTSHSVKIIRGEMTMRLLERATLTRASAPPSEL